MAMGVSLINTQLMNGIDKYSDKTSMTISKMLKLPERAGLLIYLELNYR